MAGSIFVVLLGAIYLVHGQYGFLMNWYTEAKKGEGFEYHILLLVIALVIIIKASEKWLLDGLMHKNILNDES